LPAFGEVITDVGAPRSELDSRESSPLDLPISNTHTADDDEASHHGETAAPTTDGEGEDDGDGETDAGSEEIVYEADAALVFAASVPLPDEDDDDEDGSDNSHHQGDEGETEGEAKEEGTEEEQEVDEAESNDGELATEDDDAGTPAGFSSFRHPGMLFFAADMEVTRLIHFKQTRLHMIGSRLTEPSS
jgi:hypothetical protein